MEFKIFATESVFVVVFSESVHYMMRLIKGLIDKGFGLVHATFHLRYFGSIFVNLLLIL